MSYVPLVVLCGLLRLADSNSLVLRDVALDRLRAAYVDAYNRGDSSSIGALYADSAVRMPYEAVPQRGRRTIVAATAAGFAARKFKPTLVLDPEGIIVEAATAIERGAYHELQEFASGRTAREDGKYVFVARRDAEGWKYLWSIFNRDSAAKLLPATFATPPGDRAVHTEHALVLPGAVLEYLDFGGPQGAPLVVLLPGYRDNAHAFDEFAPIIAAKYRVVALTPRGHGASATPDTGYTINTFAADVRALLDSLGAPDATLVGHSLAGSTITELAVESPGRVHALVYLDATMDLRGAPAIGSANPLPTPQPTDSSASGIQAWYAKVFFGMWNDAFANEFASVASGPNVARRAELLGSLLADARRAPKPFGSTRAPILAIVAKKSVETNFPWLDSAHDNSQRQAARQYIDSIVNPWWLAGAAQLRAARPDAQVLVIPGHHYIYMNAGARVAEEILAFVGRIGKWTSLESP